jgi:glycosyltransferase involved in cell wall biosynthesis
MVESNTEQFPFISIIVPVYNDNQYLGLLLDSLTRQTYPKARFEVIIVDNGSTEDVQAVTGRHQDVALLYERDTQSSYAARNKGITHAKGTIYVFVDSDCRATENWLCEGIAKLTESGSDMVGGQVAFDLSQKSSASEYYDALHNIQQDDKINRGTCATCNMFIRKKVFDTIGLFPQHIRSGGDVYYSKKATDSGFSLVYAPQAIVYHPARTLGPLIKKTFRVGVGKAEIKKMAQKNIGHEKIKTVQSGGIADLISPAALRKRISKRGYAVSAMMFWRIWLIGFCILGAGFLGLLYGNIQFKTSKNTDS